MKKKLIRSTFLLCISIASFLLASCSTSQNEKYGSVYELKSAYEKAGGSCLGWYQDNAVVSASESGNCDSNTVLMLFDSQTSALERATSLRESMNGYGLEVNLLLGENWLINSPDVELIYPNLGGVLIRE